MRKMLKPQLARAAAFRATDHDVRALEKIVARQRARVSAGEIAIDEDQLFTIGSPRPRKTRWCSGRWTCSWISRESRVPSLQGPGRAEISLEGHYRILDAIRRREPRRLRAHAGDIEEIETILFPAGTRSRVGRREVSDGTRCLGRDRLPRDLSEDLAKNISRGVVLAARRDGKIGIAFGRYGDSPERNGVPAKNFAIVAPNQDELELSMAQYEPQETDVTISVDDMLCKGVESWAWYGLQPINQKVKENGILVVTSTLPADEIVNLPSTGSRIRTASP